MKMEQTVCSEKLAFKIQTPGNHPEESIRQNDSLFFPYAEFHASMFVPFADQETNILWYGQQFLQQHPYAF
jgi:hypothetical protein